MENSDQIVQVLDRISSDTSLMSSQLSVLDEIRDLLDKILKELKRK